MREMRCLSSVEVIEVMPTINPYQHTSFVRDPKHGRRLYMDDVHDDLVGVPNVFTTTPTINKYRRSTDSTREILNIPSLKECEATSSGNIISDNQTINKRMLTTDSIYEIEGIPCPFTKRRGPETVNKRAYSTDSICDLRELPCPFSDGKHPEDDRRKERRRRQFSTESRHELDTIPDPFVDKMVTRDAPLPVMSNYAFASDEGFVPSQYAFGSPVRGSTSGPSIDAQLAAARSRPDSEPRRHMSFAMPNSAYDYTPYGQHVRYGPMHSDYDYTAYAQPPPYHYYPPYFAPAPLPMSPYGYHHCWCYQSGPHHSPFMGGAHTPHSYGHSVGR
ncbi:hypothetical protein Q1695_011500 [Nippostrongylus brasiliensis]|nr:hypothetical protein Q1695_011500 [Nippostrongylus brasiliensis]